jgi:hypothetical protein
VSGAIKRYHEDPSSDGIVLYFHFEDGYKSIHVVQLYRTVSPYKYNTQVSVHKMMN